MVAVAVEPEPGGRDVEAPGEELGVGAAAPVALAVPRVVELAAAGLADQVEDPVGAIGEVRAQPLGEQVLDLEGQAQKDPAGPAGAGAWPASRMRSSSPSLIAGDHRGGEHADRDPGVGQAAQGVEAPGRRATPAAP